MCNICSRFIDHDEDHYEDYCIDCYMLLETAKRALAVARRVGVRRYGPSTWKDVSLREHVEHAQAHLINFRAGSIDEDHLAHAICRLVMTEANRCN